MCRVKSRWPSGASAMGVPGWPEVARWTPSIESGRIVCTEGWSRAAGAGAVASMVAGLLEVRGGGQVGGCYQPLRRADSSFREAMPMRRRRQHPRRIPLDVHPMTSHARHMKLGIATIVGLLL